jgi:hypothetical protein
VVSICCWGKILRASCWNRSLKKPAAVLKLLGNDPSLPCRYFNDWKPAHILGTRRYIYARWTSVAIGKKHLEPIGQMPNITRCSPRLSMSFNDGQRKSGESPDIFSITASETVTLLYRM